MNNLPPSDPRRSNVSFDEWVAIFIALGTIGIILVVSLVPKERAWKFFSRLGTGETTSEPIFRVKENPLSTFIPTEKPTEAETGDRASTNKSATTDVTTAKSAQQNQTVIKSIPIPTDNNSLSIASATSSQTGELSTTTLTPETIISDTDPTVISSAPTAATPTTKTRETVTEPETSVEKPQVATPVVPVPVPSVTQTPTPDETDSSTKLSPETEAETIKEPRFQDVDKDYWAYPYIAALASRGIIRGVSAESYQPNRPITRQEFAFILENAFENQPILKAANFQDVDAEILSRLKQQGVSQTNGFLSGYPGNRFLPNEDISKLHVLVALASGLNLKPTGSPDNVLQVYQDAAQIPNYAKEKLAATTEAGIVVNNPNPQQLEPNRPATRAEVAALIYKSLVSQGKAKQITSDN
ncbi:MAG: S-layer homology domain-containing protein [Oscillatoria sp. PMC 1068.18]|nr:S-layer homology domain-containing protein [Oscillatoria sp. PMC 1076.18]MEC4989086.1 S-layer homology domain-containing protein [Oscillatoria sp. PMC 1068.18]